jgi:outer membrane biosynthesis protein TonB
MKNLTSLLSFCACSLLLLGCAQAQSARRAQVAPTQEARPVASAAPEARPARAQPSASTATRQAARQEVEPVAQAAPGDPQAQAAQPLPRRPDRRALLEGFSHIRRSTQQCLERYKKRHTTAPVEKLRVEIKVQRDGSVSQLRVDRAVRGTSFGRCLKAHADRWRFAPFSGEPIQVARSFQLK